MGEETPVVVGVGNALVDVLVNVDDAALERHGLTKGGMHLVSDEEDMWALYGDLGPAIESSGGSVANAIAHMAADGTPCGFVGKVADDQFGKVFANDLRSLGVDYGVPPSACDGGTGRSLILITPDGQRTMCTYLGAAVSLNAADVAASMPERFGAVVIEGYLWDGPDGPAAIDAAVAKADAAGARIAVTLSDSGCVERHLGKMRSFIEQYCDILLANEAEARVFAGEADLDAALDHVQESVPLAAVTHGERGSTIVSGRLRSTVASSRVDRVVDTTGAGDAYAAGFLSAHLAGADPTRSGRAGSRRAAQVIGHVGARTVPESVA